MKWLNILWIWTVRTNKKKEEELFACITSEAWLSDWLKERERKRVLKLNERTKASVRINYELFYASNSIIFVVTCLLFSMS